AKIVVHRTHRATGRRNISSEEIEVVHRAALTELYGTFGSGTGAEDTRYAVGCTIRWPLSNVLGSTTAIFSNPSARASIHVLTHGNTRMSNSPEMMVNPASTRTVCVFCGSSTTVDP